MGDIQKLYEAADFLRERGYKAITNRELAEEYYEMYFDGKKIPRQVMEWVFKKLPCVVKMFKLKSHHSCDLVIRSFFDYYKENGEPQDEFTAKQFIPMGHKVGPAYGLWFGKGDKTDLIHKVTRAHNHASGLGKIMIVENDCINGVNNRGENLQETNLRLQKAARRFESKDINHPVLKGIHATNAKKDVESDTHMGGDEKSGVA